WRSDHAQYKDLPATIAIGSCILIVLKRRCGIESELEPFDGTEFSIGAKRKSFHPCIEHHALLIEVGGGHTAEDCMGAGGYIHRMRLHGGRSQHFIVPVCSFAIL